MDCTFSFYSSPHSSHKNKKIFFWQYICFMEDGHSRYRFHNMVQPRTNLPDFLNLGMKPTRVCHCHLNESFLKLPHHREELKEHMVDYFQINKGLVSC